MENGNTNAYDIYKDISERTGGDIYLGVVGPVRTGKSTFIKRFMDLMVLPKIEDIHSKERTIDELPQSAAGKTIMTTEPKFVPKEAAKISLMEDVKVNIRLIDCVGFMVEGASGHLEEGAERMVKTPWFSHEIPFAQAAEIGTQKVIKEHSTIGLVITTDGSFTELPRESYVAAEERTVAELKKLGKPFVLLLNTTKPYGEEAIGLADSLREKYQVTVLPINCEQLRTGDIHHVLESVLYEFPVAQVDFYLPKWVEMLDNSHKIKQNLIENAGKILGKLSFVRDVLQIDLKPVGEYIKRMKTENLDLAKGRVKVFMGVDDAYYYENMSELTGVPISGEYQMMTMIKELASMKKEYQKVAGAMEAVQSKGYGVVAPQLTDIEIQEPTLIKHGNKYGIKIKATSPSIHMIRANIETEIAPIIGNEEQANDLISYVKESGRQKEGLWQTNIFGKSIGELVEDGIRSKITMMDDESQLKLQETMQKIVNDSNGGLVCIII
ncbi:stage IV sporulation protein A [Clostridia bacterium]|nr:stage IV sporulation protein A [Clostridia bacterium]